MGKITKQWSGLAKEYFTDADNFGIQCKYCSAVGLKEPQHKSLSILGKEGVLQALNVEHSVAKQLDRLVKTHSTSLFTNNNT